MEFERQMGRANEVGPENEAYRISLKRRFFRVMAALAFGVLGAASLPPLNWSLLTLVTLAGLAAAALRCRTGREAAFCGFCWGLGRNFCAFYWLREIEPVVPYLIAPVLALWPLCFAAVIPFWRDHLLTPPDARAAGFQGVEAYRRSGGSFGRTLGFAAALGCWWVVLAWSLSRLLPWNGLETALWKNPAAMQIASWTGCIFLTFLIAFFNVALVLAYEGKFRGGSLKTLLTAALLCTLTLLTGMLLLLEREQPRVRKTAGFVLIQGDLTQRRHPRPGETEEALDVYFTLSREAARKSSPRSIITWPESAIPVPLRSASANGAEFRRRLGAFLEETQRPMLLGAIDFEEQTGDRYPGVTNSAFYFDETGSCRCKYDKFHRVPYGEYVPFRRWLPEWLIRQIDLGRDLVPGRALEPILLTDDLRAGTAVCFEGSFSYVMRTFARRGANVLVVLSNDAWYPRSCEPEMHLANSVMRAVECALPMVRCGNNGGSGVVTPTGRFQQFVDTGSPLPPETRRGRGWREVMVPYDNDPEPTFFVRYGGFFPFFYLLGAGLAMAGAVRARRNELQRFWVKSKRKGNP